MWLYQKWYYDKSWGNGSHAALLPSPEPAESIPLADVIEGRWTLWFARWPPLRSKFELQEFLPRHFLMKYSFNFLQYYRFHSLRSPDLHYTFYRSSVLGKNQKWAFKFQDWNFNYGIRCSLDFDNSEILFMREFTIGWKILNTAVSF